MSSDRCHDWRHQEANHSATPQPDLRATVPTALGVDSAHRLAAAEVGRLVNELEPTLTPHQRRLLHQIRLAAETLGGIRATWVTRLRR